MAERPKWYKYIFEKYSQQGLGMIIIHPDKKYQFTGDNVENANPLLSSNVLDDIERDVIGLEFLYAHPKGPRKWRTHIAMKRKSF